jgi:hypothetical protein
MVCRAPPASIIAFRSSPLHFLNRDPSMMVIIVAGRIG